MEKQFFDYETWDMVGDFRYSFYNIILNQKIENFSKGTRFYRITMDYKHGTIEIWNNDMKKIGKFNLSLSIED